jgi:hypothetical protein
MFILGHSQEKFKEEDIMQLASAIGSSSGAVAVGQQDSGAVRQPALKLGSGESQVYSRMLTRA